MSILLQNENENLKKKILALGAAVEESLHLAVRALENREDKAAQKVIDMDFEIDDMEVNLEEDCLKLLALHQPVASDLRFVIAVLKINNDLERIGDLAVNVAERAIFLAFNPPVNIGLDFNTMSSKVKKMLKNSLDSLVNWDVDLACKVTVDDDEVDAINREMYKKVQAAIRENPNHIETLIHKLSVSRHLERIADLATNIAEDVIYMIEGKIVRHRTEDYRTPQK